jgi:hypothetical protein
MGILPSTTDARNRNPTTRSDLQVAIAQAVKKSGPGCEAFVGVIVQRATPTSSVDANWTVRGIRFGTADREKSSQALATIIERMQREFNLSEDHRVQKGLK